MYIRSLPSLGRSPSSAGRPGSAASPRSTLTPVDCSPSTATPTPPATRPNYTDPTGLSHCSQQTIAGLAFATGAAVFAYIAGLVALGVMTPALVVALLIEHFAALAQLLYYGIHPFECLV
jgi:hypothetical protein